MANEPDDAVGPVLEKFAASSGRILGYVAAAAGAMLMLGSLLADAAANRGLLLFGAAMCLVSWVMLVRPLVVAHANGVVLHNMVTDAFIPWSCVLRAKVLQTLQVVTPDKTYHGLGVTRSTRAIAKESRQGRLAPGSFAIGGGGIFGRSYQPDTGAATQQHHHGGGSYQLYVESRVEELASDRGGKVSGEPIVSWAPLPLTALAVAAGCVLLMFL